MTAKHAVHTTEAELAGTYKTGENRGLSIASLCFSITCSAPSVALLLLILLGIGEGPAGLLLKLMLLIMCIYNVQTITLAFADGQAWVSVSLNSRPRPKTWDQGRDKTTQDRDRGCCKLALKPRPSLETNHPCNLLRFFCPSIDLSMSVLNRCHKIIFLKVLTSLPRDHSFVSCNRIELA